MDCDVVLKATKVDGVFDKDPRKFENAKKFETISYDEALGNGEIGVMDKAALGLALEHETPIVVFELLKEGNITRAADAAKVGTRIGTRAA
jgi:uridylate kinase